MIASIVVGGMPMQGVAVIVLFVLAVIGLIFWIIRRRKAQIARDLARMAEMLGGTWVRSADDDDIVDHLDGTLDDRPASITYRTGRGDPHVIQVALETSAPDVGGKIEVLTPGPWIGGEARRRADEVRPTGDRAFDRKVKLLGTTLCFPESSGGDEMFRGSALHLVGREYDTRIEGGRAIAARTLHHHYYRISAEDNRTDLEALFRLVDALGSKEAG